jgi:predicted Fe-Mo cluster-binding NifX family protein
MSWRVAVASVDNVLITEHFGRAKWFYVLDIEPDGSYATVERRVVNPLCDHGGHSEAGLQGSIDAIKDCVAVLVAVIGPSAKKRLELVGISVFEQPDKVERAVKLLAAYYSRTGQAAGTPRADL